MLYLAPSSRYRLLLRVLSAAIVLLFTFAVALAQNSELQIEVLEGQGAINNVRRGTAWEPVVRITDATGSPLSGAIVTFVMPAVGASGSFVDNSKILTVQTDENGRAVARGLKPNSLVGPFEIRVTAAHGSATARAAIKQTNAAPAQAAGRKSRRLLILGLVAGGVAGGVAAAMGGGGGTTNNTASPPPSDAPVGVVTPGAPGFGPPR